MTIPLEDFSEDILGKAQRGLGIDTGTLAQRTGLDRRTIQELRNGSCDADAIRKVAPVLGIDVDTLIASAEKAWFPEQPDVPGLHTFHTHYGEMIVNAYLLHAPESQEAIVFDTGTDASAILARLASSDLTLSAICLTHSHRDHVADLDTLPVQLPSKKAGTSKFQDCASPHAKPAATPQPASPTLCRGCSLPWRSSATQCSQAPSAAAWSPTPKPSKTIARKS